LGRKTEKYKKIKPVGENICSKTIYYFFLNTVYRQILPLTSVAAGTVLSVCEQDNSKSHRQIFMNLENG